MTVNSLLEFDIKQYLPAAGPISNTNTHTNRSKLSVYTLLYVATYTSITMFQRKT